MIVEHTPNIEGGQLVDHLSLESSRCADITRATCGPSLHVENVRPVACHTQEDRHVVQIGQGRQEVLAGGVGRRKWEMRKWEPECRAPGKRKLDGSPYSRQCRKSGKGIYLLGRFPE